MTSQSRVRCFTTAPKCSKGSGEVIGWTGSVVSHWHLHHQLFQMISPLKPLARLKLNCMWSLFGMGEYYFVHKVWITWSELPSCPYMVKALWKSSLKPQGWLMILSWWLTFLRKGQIDIAMHLDLKNIEKTFFHKLLKTDESYLAQMLYQPRIWKFINVKVIGIPLTFVSRSHEFTFSNDFCSVTPGPRVTVFHI